MFDYAYFFPAKFSKKIVCCVLLHDLQWENKMNEVNDIIIIVCNLNMMHLPERNVLVYFYCVLL